MTTLDFDLQRTVVIRARPETVFRYFTDSGRFARWWGEGSTIEPRPRGKVRIVYPNGIEAGGEVLEIESPVRIVFSYGYASGQPIGEGASRVTVTLAEVPEGTRVELRHALPDAAIRDAHVGGWRYQLAVFANVVAAEEHSDPDVLVDRWFAAWSETDAGARRAILEEVAEEGVAFRDAYGCVRGREDLADHVGAVHTFLGEARIERVGASRHCQGTVLADWRIAASTGEAGGGTNVFELSPDGRIRAVVGFRGA